MRVLHHGIFLVVGQLPPARGDDLIVPIHSFIRASEIDHGPGNIRWHRCLGMQFPDQRETWRFFIKLFHEDFHSSSFSKMSRLNLVQTSPEPVHFVRFHFPLP
jgi:hypothetical protein